MNNQQSIRIVDLDFEITYYQIRVDLMNNEFIVENTIEYYVLNYNNSFFIKKQYQYSDLENNIVKVVHIIDMDGMIIYYKKYLNNELLEIYNHKDKKRILIEECDVVPVYHYTDWYLDRGNGTYEYDGSTLTHISYEENCDYIYYPTSYQGGNGSGYWNPSNYNPDYNQSDGNTVYVSNGALKETEIEGIVLTNEVDANPCVSSIISDLQTKSNLKGMVPISQNHNSLAYSVFELFTNNKVDLVFEFNNHITGNGKTDKSISGGKISIYLNENYVNTATKLSIARTIIHESIHAYLVYQYTMNPNDDFSVSINRYYEIYNKDITLTHHNFIAQFVSGIASSLAVWDNNSQLFEYYEKLAWGGFLKLMLLDPYQLVNEMK